MGKIIINNLSKIRDEQALRLAYQILAECSEKLICETADEYHVDVGVRTDDAIGDKTFTITDRD